MKIPKRFLVAVLLCAALSACAGGGVRKKSAWEGVRYQDNDASYTAPVTSCMDDSPQCI